MSPSDRVAQLYPQALVLFSSPSTTHMAMVEGDISRRHIFHTEGILPTKIEIL
jgi:hypothetical protein